MQQAVRSLTVLALVAIAAPSLAQSPTAVGVDSEAVLVNKNVGTQQWAISRSFATRSVSGNVFTPGGEVQFVFCEQRGILNDVLQLACYGTGRCDSSPCADAWIPIATIALPASFFAVGPEGEPGLEGLLGRWRAYDYTDAVTLRERLTLSTVTDRAGVPTVVGEDAAGHEVLVQRFADVDPGMPSPYEFIAGLNDGSICRFYSFNRVGDVLRGRLQAAPADGAVCGPVLETYQFEAARLGTVAMMMPVPMAAEDPAAERALAAARASIEQAAVVRLP